MEAFTLSNPEAPAKRLRQPKPPAPKSDDIRMKGQHSAESVEWYTPPNILDAAREALGGEIDLDPASCELVNRKTVRALTFYDEASDGLNQLWAVAKDRETRLFCNPPTPARRWWELTVSASLMARVAQGVYLAYSLEQIAQASVAWTPAYPMVQMPFCIPGTHSGRIHFLCTAESAAKQMEEMLARRLKKTGKGPTMGPKGEQKRLDGLRALDPTELVVGAQSPHASAIISVGCDAERFARAFRAIGPVRW